MAGISMRELAELLGVSVASVSVALRGKPGISEETRIRILEEADRQGYDRSRLSQAASKGVIEVVDYTYYNHCTSPQEVPYYRQLLDAVTTGITSHGYTLSGPFNPSEAGFASRPSADGGILLGSGITPEELSDYRSRQIPFVITGNPLPEFPVHTVSHDNYYGIQAALSHLLALEHTRIGYVGSMQGPAGTERWQAYQLGLQQKGLTPAEVCEIHTRQPADLSGSPSPDSSVSSGTAPLSLSDYLLQQLDDWLDQAATHLSATAFVCDSDYTAAALMRSLRSHGIIPGRDVSVTGFDDQPFSALLEPPLTSVHTYEPELGTAAVEQLIYCLEHPDCHFRHVKVGTDLIVRESTGKPPEKI